MRKQPVKQAPIGERIAARRKALGQSREDLALHWNRALSTIRNWEIGLSEPKDEDLTTVEAWLAENGSRRKESK